MDWELNTVEQPFIRQLIGLGWRHVEGDIDKPGATGRTSFTEVVQEVSLRRQLRALNLHDGQAWLDEARLSQAVNAISRIPANRLMEANQAAYTRQAGFSALQHEQLVLNYVRQHGSIRRSEVIDLCRLTPPQARDLLKRLKGVGQLMQHGQRRGSHYTLADSAKG